MPPRKPVVSFLPTGQPITRTTKGPRFAKYGAALGPFERAGERITTAMADGIVEVATKMMEQSQLEVPKEFGTLARSARFTVTETVTGDIEVLMGYGFGDEIDPKRKLPASGYAVPVHEKLEARHAPPTKAKFLEDPVLEWASTIQPFLAANIKASLISTGAGAFNQEAVAAGATLAFEEG